jgi:hypothetical protein
MPQAVKLQVCHSRVHIRTLTDHANLFGFFCPPIPVCLAFQQHAAYVVKAFVLVYAMQACYRVTQGYEPGRNEQELTVALRNFHEKDVIIQR